MNKAQYIHFFKLFPTRKFPLNVFPKSICMRCTLLYMHPYHTTTSQRLRYRECVLCGMYGKPLCRFTANDVFDWRIEPHIKYSLFYWSVLTSKNIYMRCVFNIWKRFQRDCIWLHSARPPLCKIIFRISSECNRMGNNSNVVIVVKNSPLVRILDGFVVFAAYFRCTCTCEITPHHA